MKIQRKVALLLCAVLLICSLSVTALAADDFPTVLAEAKKGVVQIYGVASDSKYIYSWVGTGFAVGEEGKDSDVFLTNWHVVTHEDNLPTRIWILQENCTFDERTLEPDPSKSIECKVLKTTTGYPDYAIIQATEPVTGYKPLKLMKSSDDVPDGTKVYALGYPAVVGDASVTHYGIDDITSTDGMISQHMQYAYAGNTWVLMHTANISGGNSGGPLITEDGAVVGLNTYIFGETRENMNRCCAVYIDYAIEGLDELGIPYTLSDGSTSGGDGEDGGDGKDGEDGEDGEEFDWSNPVLLVIPAAIIVVVAVVIVLVKKKEKEEAERRQAELRRRQEEERQRQEAERQRQEAERLRMEKAQLEEKQRQQEEKRRQEEAARRAAAQQPPVAQLKLNGNTIGNIPATGCTIGRGVECTIALPSDAPGISRQHCKLEVRQGQLFLIDLGSSYGTYYHGQRIAPNTPTPVRVGSTFFLGSERYRFTIG